MKAKVLYDFGYVSDDNLPIYDSNHKFHSEIEKDDVVDVNMNIKADAKDVLNGPYGMCYLCKHNGKYRYIPIRYLDIDYSKKDIDWEQRMYETTIASISIAYKRLTCDWHVETANKIIAKDAIDIAKEIIKQLKEIKDETV